jgi:hypothetical protein
MFREDVRHELFTECFHLLDSGSGHRLKALQWALSHRKRAIG